MKTEAILRAAGDIPTAHLEFVQWLRTVWRKALGLARRKPRGLRLCESLPLGERRFVAVVEYENSRFLLGGTPTSLVLLTRLKDRGISNLGASGPNTEAQPEDV
ncbi:MAG TPA: flagellar biosynthetic protein FliO [Candidatus Sulfotelmatobacter sp.]|jgi:flagellar biogenesis protein FliO|nr:flagellar biosynthetic protein FliO [Candidatus Sulfotelmatobacter sp.]